jgi:hypothetical protein
VPEWFSRGSTDLLAGVAQRWAATTLVLAVLRLIVGLGGDACSQVWGTIPTLREHHRHAVGGGVVFVGASAVDATCRVGEIPYDIPHPSYR